MPRRSSRESLLRSSPAPSSSRRSASPPPPSLASLRWIQTLALPYLQGFLPVPQRAGSLAGFWFLHPSFSVRLPRLVPPPDYSAAPALGFFLGSPLAPSGLEFLSPEPPECIAFAFVAPLRGSLHDALVAGQGSLLRSTYTYIGWLTHRRPRFVFHPDRSIVLARHAPMRAWPLSSRSHLSRNFYIETLCWLVRSALVRKFLAASLPA